MANLSDIITPTNLVTFTGTDTLTNKTLTAPVLTTPNLGTPSALVLTNATGTLTSPTFVTPALGTPASGVMTSVTGLPLTTGVTGTLPVANGGTGATTLTANNVVLGNGTSAVQVVAPSTSGNVLTSDGTTWASTAPVPSGFSAFREVTLLSGPTDITGTASIAFTGLTSTYQLHVLVFTDITTGGAHNPTLLYSADGGSSYPYGFASTNGYRSYQPGNSTWQTGSDTGTRNYTNSDQVTGETWMWNIGRADAIRGRTVYLSFDDASNSGYQVGKSNNGANVINAIKFTLPATPTRGLVSLYGVIT